jgi:hypothetical protein
MPDVVYRSLVTVLAVDLVIALVSIPLILRKIPRNAAYGVRTRATMSSDAVWYDANAFGGRALLLSSIASALLMIWFAGIEGLAARTVMNGSIAILAGPPLLAVVLTLRYAARRAAGAAGESR